MTNTASLLTVSIIMPTYNRAKYILETIESIRQQTYPYWELIIVDDGSDDNTEEIVARVKDERIQLYKAGRIGIGGKIKNIGLEKARGELIAFIDSDDLWSPEKIEKQVIALAEYPGAGFVLTGGYNFRIAGEPIDFFYKQKTGIRYEDLFIACFKSEVTAFTQALMLRKECITTTGNFKEVNAFSDADFIIRLARHFKGIIIYEPLVYRRLHDTNHSSSNWEKSYDEGIENIRAYKKELPPAISRDALFGFHINFGERYLTQKQNGKAIGQFAKAWVKKPFSSIPFKKTGKAIFHFVFRQKAS